jgi:TonB family protein
MVRKVITLGLALAASFAINTSAQDQDSSKTASGSTGSAPPASDSRPPGTQGGVVTQAKLIHMVQPVYPEDARKSNISGTVVLHGVIAKDGSLQQIEVVSGPDELRQAAIDAVMQWQYQPTTLSGKPVEAATTISLVFGSKPSEGQAPTAAPNTPAGSLATGSDPSAAPDVLKEPELAPKPPPPSRALPTRIKIGGTVQSAALIRLVKPEYPDEARLAHITGTVRLHTVIARDGSVQDVQYVSGPLMLENAAIDAVKQWRYRPTRINGQPVEVDTTIDVVFQLGP